MVFLSSRELSPEDEEVKIFIYLFIYLFKLKGYGWVVDVFSVFLFMEQIKSSFLLPRWISSWCVWKCFRVYQEILQEMMSQREKGQFLHTYIW